MINIKTLLANCGDVKIATIENICEILDNQRKPVAKDKRTGGQYPYYGANGVQDYVDDYIFDGTFLLIGEDGSVINKDNSPVVNWAVGKIWVNNHAHILKEKPEIANLRYVYYALQTIDVSDIIAGTPPKLNQGNLKNIKLPLPPLSTQLKIVEVLDKFTSLEKELEKELEMRKKQYQYYRDKLLTFKEEERERWGVREVKIGDVCVIVGRIGFRGYTRQDQVKQGEGAISLSPANIEGTRLNYDNCTYITWEKYEESPEIMVKNGDIVFCKTASVGKTAFVENLPQEATINPQFILLKNIKCNAKYLSYLLQSTMFQKAVEKIKSLGTIHTFSQKDFNNLYIEIPSLTRQKEIVEILDKFDTLVNDISKGLPREIELRRKQYEYYRGELLRFG